MGSVIREFEKMSGPDLLFLCKCAQQLTFYNSSEIADRIGIDLKKVHFRDFFDNGYIYNYSGYWTNYFNLKFYLPVVVAGWKTIPYKLEQFSKTDTRLMSRPAIFLWNFVKDCYHDGKIKMYTDDEWIFSEDDTYDIFTPVLDELECRNFFKCLPSVMFEFVINHSVFMGAILDADYSGFSYERYMDLIGIRKPNPIIANVEDRINLYNFFLTGELKKFKGLRSKEYTLAIEAIKALYRRDFSEAYALFTNALKEHNESSLDKNYFYIPQLNFYLAICYALVNTEQARKKAAMFVKKKDIKDRPEYRPALIMAEFVCLDKTKDQLSEYGTRYKGQNAFSSLNFHYNLMVHMLKVDPNYLTLNNLIDKKTPREILLGYELSPYTKCFDKEQNEKIMKIVGGRPLLSEIKQKNDWEKVISDIVSILPSAKKADVPTKRFAYYFYGTSIVEIREQKLSSSGEWKKGAKVALSSFVNGKKEITDPTDIQIRNKINSQYYYGISPYDIIPFLVDSDRVYYYLYDVDEAKSVKIREEKVYVSVKKNTNGSFSVSTNLPINNVKPVIITKISDTEYTVVKLSELAQNILTRLQKIKEVPSEAEKSLKEFLQILGKNIEIHSPLVEGTDIQVVDSSSVINLYIKPRNGAYVLMAFIKPLPNGKLELIPGRGKDVAYDYVEGKRYEIKRNIKLELEYFAELTSYMYGNFDDLEEMDEENSWLLDPKNLLDLLNFVKEKEDKFCVKWPEGQAVKIKAKISSSNVSVSLKHKENWFEMEGTVSLGDNSNISIKELLALFANSGDSKYIKLSDQEYLTLEDSLRKQLKMLDDVTYQAKRIPVYQIGALADMIYGDKPFIKTDKAFKELEKKIDLASKLNPDVPKLLNGELRDYQYNGFAWMVRLASWGAGACLADEMGLGKTIQTIALMLYRKGPHLVVAPASVVFNWVHELQTFAPTLNISVLNETSDSRKSIVEEAKEGDVVICSYGILQREEDLIASKKWDLVCLDEAHTIKNHGTKTSMAAMKIQADCRVALTGTPIQNNLVELWNIFQFLNPGVLGTHESFIKKFGTGSEMKGNGKRLKSLIQPFILRRRKSDVVEELPDKVDSQRLIELSTDETIVYEAIRESTAKKLKDSSKVDVNILAQITKLRQAACSIGLIETKWTKGSSKEDSAIELISQIVESGNRVLVFSQFTKFLTSVQEKLASVNPEIQSLYLDGSTPIKKRETLVNSFQQGTGSVFFISLKAGGLGLNLTGANYVIHMDPWWNPAIESQATDRAHRIGQKQNVTVYHLISDHTIEEKILRLHKTKKDMADYLMEGTDVGQSITLDDLRELVSY